MWGIGVPDHSYPKIMVFYAPRPARPFDFFQQKISEKLGGAKIPDLKNYNLISIFITDVPGGMQI